VEAASLAVLACFLAVHALAPRLRFLEGLPRSIWLSISGGVSIAYVFVHLLPELSAGQRPLSDAIGSRWSALEHHVYLIALLGLAAFYGLDRLALESRRRQRADGGDDCTTASVFWIHIASFALYNALIGYLLLHGEQRTPLDLWLFGLAMSLHFVVTDHALLAHHKTAYRRFGRWVLGLSAASGWTIGLMTAVSEAAVAALFAFLAGGVMLNVLKEELPEERQSRYWAFAAGAGGYAGLLLAI
jgi:hypothetical protein